MKDVKFDAVRNANVTFIVKNVNFVMLCYKPFYWVVLFSLITLKISKVYNFLKGSKYLLV